MPTCSQRATNVLPTDSTDERRAWSGTARLTSLPWGEGGREEGWTRERRSEGETERGRAGGRDSGRKRQGGARRRRVWHGEERARRNLDDADAHRGTHGENSGDDG